MSFAKPMLLALLVVALAAYAFNCGAATTPEQAMQCCNSMSCSSHGHHAQDCCKTMQAIHAPFVQPASVKGISYCFVALGVVPAAGKSLGLDSPDPVITAHCHAPPIRYIPAPRPLRI